MISIRPAEQEFAPSFVPSVTSSPANVFFMMNPKGQLGIGSGNLEMDIQHQKGIQLSNTSPQVFMKFL